MIAIPEGLRTSVSGAEGGDEWLQALPDLAARAVDRWKLTLGQPFEGGMSSWAAPAQTAEGEAAVLKLSYPHTEARHEAAALRIWAGRGTVPILDSHEDDWALLLARCTPGTALRDEGLPEAEHLRVAAQLMGTMASTSVPADAPFPTLTQITAELADVAEERIDRFTHLDRGFLLHGVDLLRTLPLDAPLQGLAHGDFNPGNILRSSGTWVAIDPKPVVGDLAWDPWPLLTQLGDWQATTPSIITLTERVRLVADLSGLEGTRMAAWSTARSIESALWAANRGWWTGPRGAQGELERAQAWAAVTR